MNKNSKKLLSIVFIFIFIISTLSVIGTGLLQPASQTKSALSVMLTGTPEDTYKPEERKTYCQSDGAHTTEYIQEFKIPTLCTQPLAITTDPAGHIWFVETNTGDVVKFDPISKTFREFDNLEWQKGEKSMMWGIYRTAKGDIWFTDSLHRLIWKFDVHTNNYTNFIFTKTLQQDSFPQRIIPDGKHILVNDFYGKKFSIFDINQTGNELHTTDISSPKNYNFTSDATVDNSEKIWYTIWTYKSGGNLVSYDPQISKFSEYLLPPEMQAPNGIGIDQSGKIWIADTGTSFFFSFDPKSMQFTRYVTTTPPVSTYGNSSGLIKTPITRPYWIKFDDQGRLWFNEQVANSLAVFDPVKESLVEYLIPSKNPNWSDCGTQQNCGVAQVFDFTLIHDKVWFTEWVQNNIGVLDTSIKLPIDIRTASTSVLVSRGQNVTLSITLSPNEFLNDTVNIMTAETSSMKDLKITYSDENILVDKPKIVTVKLSADKFASPGVYKILIGARYHDITVSKFINATIK